MKQNSYPRPGILRTILYPNDFKRNVTSYHAMSILLKIKDRKVLMAAVTRRLRRGDIAATDSAAAVAQFRYDFAHRYRLIDLTPPLVARAMTLAETHSLRGYDAVQLAPAVEVHIRGLPLGLPALTLVSADGELNMAARAEGLIVEDPNAH